MTYKFQLSCESTADMPYAYMTGRDISVLFYTYTVDGVEYEDNMEREQRATEEFFSQLKAGCQINTSQINAFRYEEYFEKLLEKGDVLHINFGTGMTPSYHHAVEAAQTLREKYPQRKLVIVDSLASCGGYGILVDRAADLRDEGKSLEEVESWLLQNRNRVHHQFFTTDLTQFKKSGRVSGPVALVGSILGLCPIMHLNAEGRMIAYSKVRGKKAAVRTSVEESIKHMTDCSEAERKLYVCHSNCPELFRETMEALQEKLSVSAESIRQGRIGPVISAHAGADTVAIFFFGDERTAE